MKKVLMIGIAGGSASGKTSIANKLKDQFEHSFQIIKMDDYYNDQSEMSLEQRYLQNYDHPLAFDNDLMHFQLNQLKQGHTIEKPVYDYVQHTRSDKIETIYPTDVVVIEGLFALEDETMRELLDIKIFVDTPADVRFIRRLLRDVKKRGRSLESVVHQYMNTVRVMHEQFVEPSKRYADVIIPEGGHNKVAIDLLVTKINSIIAQNML